MTFSSKYEWETKGLTYNLGPTLCTLFISDLPTTSNTTLGTFADNIAILSVLEEPYTAATSLQHHLSALQNWF
jgi:hypothetical protein